MAAAPTGLFSGVWSRLHAAAYLWRRRGQLPGGDDRDGVGEEEQDEAAAVRSRLARRAATARRLGRKLAFVSFNLEVLVFVYAFWRARRRSFTWRLPAQALPMLLIPALATLIYAAFVRFTRMLDLKDKKRLERLQQDKQQTDAEPREFDQNDQNDVQNCDGVDDATDSIVATDSVPHTPKLGKHSKSSISQRDDSEIDMAWGHSNDFQPAPSGGLRLRRFSSAKTCMTNSSATERSEENTSSISAHSHQHVHILISTEDNVSYPSDNQSRSAMSSMLAQPANVPQELPAGGGENEKFDGLWDITGTCSSYSKENRLSPAGPHNSFCDRDDSRSSGHAVSYLSTAFQELLVKGVEEKASPEPHTSAMLQLCSSTSEENPTSCVADDKELIIISDVETCLLPPICSNVHDNAAIVNIDTASPKWNLLLQLYGVEHTGSSKFHIPEESTTPSNLEEVLMCPPSVNSIERCLGTPEFSFCSRETEKLEVAGNDSFTDDNPEFSFVSSPELVVEGGKGATEKELCEVKTNEENAIINMEEEALQDPLIETSSTSAQCLEASDVYLCIQDAKIREVPGITNFVTANSELMYPASTELLAQGDEDIKEDKTSNFLLMEQNDVPSNFEKEPILDSLVADTDQHFLVTPLYSEEVEITEVHDVVKEGIFESEGEKAFDYRKLVVTPSYDDSNTPSLISDSMPVQFIPNTDINEALEGSQETFSEPLHQSTRQSEGMFLSSGESNNDEVYSSNSNSYANVVEDEAPLVGQEGLSTFQEEMPITFSDSPIFLDEVKSAASVDSDASSPELSLQTDLHGVGVEENESSKSHVPEEIRTPFSLEEVLLSPRAVNNGSLFKQLKFICQSAGTPEFSLCNQESEEAEVTGSVSFIKASPESFLSSPELVAEGGEDARDKETGGMNSEGENVTLVNLEDEALQELLAEGGKDLKEHGTSDVHLHEQKGLYINLEEPFLDPLVVDTAEDALVTPELLMCSEEVKMTEVHRVVKEVFSEVEDEGAFDHQKLVLTSPDYDGTTQNLIRNSISGQFIPDASVKGASKAGQEPLSEPPHESTCHSEGTFLSSGEINHDEVKVKAPFAGQEGPSKSEDEMALTPLDTSILLDEVASTENLTDNSGSSQSIPNSNQTQSLHGHEQAPSETSQEEVTSLLEGSHTSSDEGINSEIFSLYSRSSSCVSEINMLETLRGGTSSESPSGRDSSFGERNPVTFSNMDSTESNTNDPVTAEFILETNMTETLNAAEESIIGSPHADSSNFLGTFVAPDVINDMTESDKHLDLLSSSFAPVIDAFESLETGQGFSELQSEIGFTVQETLMFPKEVNNAENYFTDTIGGPQDSERTAVVALLDEDLTLHRAYMSPEDVSDVQNSLADDYASDLPHMVESHCISEKLSPESQDPLISEEILLYPDEVSNAEPLGDPEDREDEDLTLHRAYVSPEDTSDVEKSSADDYASDLPHMAESHCGRQKLSLVSQDPLSSQVLYPDEGSTAENDLGTAYPPLRSTEVNLAEPCGIYQERTQQHDGTMLASEDIYMVDQEADPENLDNNSGSLDVPDATMTDSLRGAEIVTSEILYDGMFSFEGTLISLDGDTIAEEDSPNKSGSGMHTAQANTTSLLGLQEGSLKLEHEKAVNSIVTYEVDTKETSSSNRGNSSSALTRHDISFMEAPQECHIHSESEKVSAKDKEPKEDGESNDMKEDVEDLDDDREHKPVGTFWVDEITSALVPKPSVELSANDVSRRDSAIGTSNDFDMAVRKPVVTISNSNGSSTVSEPADVQYTGSIDETETLGAPLPSAVAAE
ncbi:uncharacterized protein LOC124691014 [Lolium rigidum]|uniref:uncharacterized protein LOC124691014 n=1 Tax=Lolium rigidum TaxID=89674 RepID=UPI001F5D018A|nr:uncharacterized protein LOC124691014 [Lolium rigidum]